MANGGFLNSFLKQTIEVVFVLAKIILRSQHWMELTSTEPSLLATPVINTIANSTQTNMLLNEIAKIRLEDLNFKDRTSN